MSRTILIPTLAAVLLSFTLDAGAVILPVQSTFPSPESGLVLVRHRGMGIGLSWGCGGPGDLPIDCFRGDDDYYNRQPYHSGNRHVTWCKARYKSYNSRSDSFTGKSGKKYHCNSPYDKR